MKSRSLGFLTFGFVVLLQLGLAGSAAAAPQLVTLRNGGTEVHLSDTNGANDELLAQNFSPRSFALVTGPSPRSEKLFFCTDYDVYSASPDGTGLHRLNLGTVYGDQFGVIAVDAHAAKLYFQKNSGPIMRADFDGSNPETVIPSDVLRDVETIRLDPDGEKIYWTDYQGVRRANYDGSSIELIVDSADYPDSYGNVLAADFDGGKIYFATYEFIYSANLDGTAVTQLAPVSLGDTVGRANHLETDLVNGRLYWSCTNYDFQGLCAVNLDGSDPQLISNSFFGFRSLSPFIVDGRSENATFIFGYHREQELILRRTLDLAPEETIVRGDLAAENLVLNTDLGAFDIYWADSSRGAIMKLTPPSHTPEEIVSDLSYPIGLSIDRDAQKIYWTDFYDGVIRRANLDGSQKEDLVTGIQNPTNLSIDYTRGIAYWIAAGTEGLVLQRTTLGSGDIRNVAAVNPLSKYPITIDPISNYLYGSIGADGEVQRISPRTGKSKTIFTLSPIQSCGSPGCWYSPPIVTDVHFQQPVKLFYVTAPAAAQSIVQAEKDGDNHHGINYLSLIYKFQFTAAPQDDVPPILNSVKVKQKGSKITFSWKTDERTDAAVEYGPSQTYGSLKYESSSRRRPGKRHKVVVSLPKTIPTGTVYYFRLRSRDAYGNLSVSDSLSVTL